MSGRHFLHPIRKIHMDIFKFEEYESFDMVYVNFFLNAFSRVVVLPLLDHFARMIKENGFIVISDFASLSGRLAARLVQDIYWYIADIFLSIAANNVLHPIYDYHENFESLGFTIEEVKYCRLLCDNRYYSILRKRH
jgi:hypothetical protein